MLEKAVFLLSIDTELAWGSVHNGAFARYQGHYQRTREAITRLLALLERYEIHATWAVVGHLFLERCQPRGGVKHPEITRPTYPWFTGDWFATDPGGDRDHDPFWYGPDIVAQIRRCPVRQEIGSHGFSHLIVGDPGCSRECFDSELQACRAEAERWGIPLQSFVFPRNSIGHLDTLAAHGFTAYRGVTPAWHARFPRPLRRAAHLVDSLLPVAPPTPLPRKDGPLWNLPASYFYPHRDGWARLIPVGIGVRKARRGLARAAQQRALFHLWFHPFNLASDPDALLAGLEDIFNEVKALREGGALASLTMGELAAQLQQAEQEVIS